MKQIKLSQQGKNKGKYVVLVDDEDFEYLNQWRWCAVKYTHTYYAVRYDKKRISMHRLILDVPQNKLTDHRDSNGLNNQIKNIRPCTNL